MPISINMGDVVYIFKCVEKKRNSFVRSNFSNNNTSSLNRVTILEQGCVSNENLMHVR